MASAETRAATGDLLRTFKAAPPPAPATPCANDVGIAFDGTDLLLSCRFSNRIDVVRTSDGSFVRQVTVPSPLDLGALAFDATRGKVWACTPGAPNSSIVLVDANPGAGGAVANPIVTQGAGCYDGLAFAAPSDLYHSSDMDCDVGRTKVTGQQAGGAADICTPPLLGGGGNSGLAVGGSDLYMATWGARQIYRVPKSFASSTLFKTVDRHPEDLECDDVTFPGVSALWMISNQGRSVSAYEVANGTCNYGGSVKGTLQVCKVAGAGVQVQPPFVFAGSPFDVNGGATFTIPAGPPPNGYCVTVGSFRADRVTTVRELKAVGRAVSQIDVNPSGRLVQGSLNMAGQKVDVRVGLNDVTKVTFTDKAVPTGYVKICKKTEGRFRLPLPHAFLYSVPGAPAFVPVATGRCSSPIKVTAGEAVTVHEHEPLAAVVSACAVAPASRLFRCNGAAATVEVIAGDETVVTFTNVNRPVISGPLSGDSVRRSRLTPGVITAVLDGRTLRVRTAARTRAKHIRGRETVRLIGIDPPRFTRLGASEQCGGRDATNAMLHFAFGDRAKDTDADALDDDTGATRGLGLILDTALARPRRDRSGRLLAYVYDESTGDDLARRLIAAGWARRSRAAGRGSRYARYGAAQSKARRSKRGVWSLCHGDFELNMPVLKPPTEESQPEER